MGLDSCGILTSCAALSLGDVLVTCQPQSGSSLKDGDQANSPGGVNND